MLGTVRLSRRDISEWQPLWTVPVVAWVPWTIAAVATVFVLVRNGLKEARTAVVLAALGYAALRVERLEAFFVTAAFFLIAPSIRRAWPNRVSLGPREHRLVTIGLCTAAVIVAVVGSRSFLRCIPIEGFWIPDQQAAAPLANAVTGKLVTYFDWGEYAIWHFGPGLRVSMDGRRETVYSDRRLGENGAIVAGTPEGFALIAEWRPEYVWLPATSAKTRSWLVSHGYRIDRASARSFVAVREDLPTLVNTDPSSERRCFP
jgi:hypothetical protein